MRKRNKILLSILLPLAVILLGLPWLLYVPAIQDFACDLAVDYLNETSTEMQYKVGSIHIGFPLRLQVRGVLATHKEKNDTIFSLGLLETGLDDIPLGGKYFGVRQLSVEEAVFRFPRLTESLTLFGNVEKLHVTNVLYNPSGELEIGEVLLPEPKVFVMIRDSKPDSLEEESGDPLLIAVKHLKLTDGKVGLVLDTARLDPAAFDYNHLRLDSLHVDVTDFVMNGPQIRCKLNGMIAREMNSGMQIDELHTDFSMDGSRIMARDFFLKMPETELAGQVDLDYHYFTGQHTGNVNVDLEGYVASRDVKMHVMPYVPDMAEYWPDESTAIEVLADAAGDTVRQLFARAEVENRLSVNVRASAVHPWADSIRRADITVQGSLPDADWVLSAFVADSSRRACRIPRETALEVSFRQAGEYVTAKARVEHLNRVVTDLEASFHQRDESYQARGQMSGLNIGEWVPSIPIDNLNGHLVASGRHFNLQSKYARLDAEVAIDSLYYWRGEQGFAGGAVSRRDSLKDVFAEAELLHNKYVVNVMSHHDYLDFDAALEGLYRKDTVTAVGNINLRNADLANLPTDIQNVGAFALRMDINAAYDWNNDADVHVLVDSLHYTDKGETVHLKDMRVDMHSCTDTAFVLLEGGDAHVLAHVSCGLGQMNRSFAPFLDELDRELKTFHINVDTLQELLPQAYAVIDMKQDNPFYPVINYYGWGFDAVRANIICLDELFVDANVCQLWGDGVDFDTIRVSVKPVDQGVGGYDYDAHVVYIDPKPKDSFSAQARGVILKDSLTVDVRYVNGRNVLLYDLYAALALGGDTVTLRFGEHPVIYAQQLDVNHDNYLRLTKFRNNRMQAPELEALLMLDGPNDLLLSLLTNPVPTGGNRVSLDVRHLDLGYLRETVKWEHQVSGILNLDFEGLAIPDSVAGRLDIGVRNLKFGDWKTDTAHLTGQFRQEFLNHPARHPADAQSKQGVLPKPDIESELKGIMTIDNRAVLDVDFYEHDSMRLDVAIEELPLPMANPFMPANLPLGGEAWGAVHVTQARASRYAREENTEPGPMVISAELALHDGTVSYRDAGATLHLPADTIRMTDNYISISDYQVRGSNENPLTLNGFIDLRKDFSNPVMSLSLDGNNVELFNSRRRGKSQTIAGSLLSRINLRVAGALSKLRVSGNVNALSGTELQYYLTDDPLASVSKTDQMVEFVRFSQLDAKNRIPKKYFETRETLDEGTSIDLKINISRDTKAYVHLGGQGDDHLNIVGGGDLRFGSTSDGTLSLNGTYDAHSGELNYKLPVLPISKDFNVQDGSSVIFSGEIGDPELNLTASEDVRCSVNDATTGTRVVNFKVFIYIKGTLERMTIDFDCSAPGDASMQANLSSLTDEERTKQAINLLVTQTYTGPGASSNAGISTANAALNSILQREVESLINSQKQLKHTQVSVGIDNYETSSGSNRTDFSVKVSQGFFDDKVRVTVGGRMSAGDSDETMGRRSDAVINDVSVDWMLKKDGSHYITLFRKTNFESVLEGEIVEMGVGYVRQREAMRFKDLFIFNTEARRKRLLERLKMLEDAGKAKDAK